MNYLTCTLPNSRIPQISDLEDFWDLSNGTTPANHWYESEESYRVEIDLPGVRKEDVSIKVEAGELRITAVRNFIRNEKTERLDMSQAFILPDEVDVEKIVADQKDGVLMLTLPKKEEAKPKSISINVN